MSKLLEQAFKKLKSLPPEDQDALASLILNEIEDEENWHRSFSSSSNVLAKMAEKAMMEYQAGLTKELDPDRL
jgi:hypothetical protein